MGQLGPVAAQEVVGVVRVGGQAAAEMGGALAVCSREATQGRLRGEEHVQDSLAEGPVQIVQHTPEENTVNTH